MTRQSVEQRREQLVHAAIAVMSDEGFEAATTRRIAEHAQVQLATVHYAFRNKQELLSAVLQQVTAEIATTIGAAITPEGGLTDAVADSINAFWTLVERSPELQLMQYELTTYALRTPELAWLAEWQYQRYCEVVTSAYRKAATAHEPPAVPIPQLARLVVAGVDGIILQFVSHGNVRKSRQDIRNLTRMTRALL